MLFPLSLLTTVADCDALLTSQQREHARLTRRLHQLDYQLQTWESPETLEAAIAAARSVVAAFGPVVGTAPAGPERLRLENEQHRAAIRLNRLLLRAENRGRRARLERELARAQAQASLALLDTFLAELTAHRAALCAQAGEAQATDWPEHANKGPENEEQFDTTRKNRRPSEAPALTRRPQAVRQQRGANRPLLRRRVVVARPIARPVARTL